MKTQAERAEEKRQDRLEEMDRQIKDGSLKVRKMTAAERKRFPPVPAKAKAPRR
jgi:hypothetical protein